MATVKVDSGNEENFQPREFKMLPRGIYLFEIANSLKVEGAKTSTNNKVKVQLKCVDDAKGPDGSDYKGATVFDEIGLTQKGEFKLVHLALAAGTQTREDIKERGVDLDVLQGKIVKAEITTEGPSTDPRSGKTYPEKNRVMRYVFDKA